MRKLTFAGFLRQYTASLSVVGGGLYQMAHEAMTSNARLRAPLFLYALYQHKLPVLFNATGSSELKALYANLLVDKTPEAFQDALEHDDPDVPVEYQKIWHSYVVVRDMPDRDAHTKALVRNKALQLQSQSGVSTYRACKDLALNRGNVNAWLKHGDNSKVSLATARKVMQYMQSSIINE